MGEDGFDALAEAIRVAAAVGVAPAVGVAGAVAVLGGVDAADDDAPMDGLDRTGRSAFCARAQPALAATMIKTSGSSRLLSAFIGSSSQAPLRRGFQCQQCAFRLYAAEVSAQAAVGSHDPVAGHDHR
ncbi:MAG: hypothetical protein JWN95_4054 [Frankiales bacterium]|nr:hypothetical protein [Frankiales bacterium]